MVKLDGLRDVLLTSEGDELAEKEEGKVSIAGMAKSGGALLYLDGR